MSGDEEDEWEVVLPPEPDPIFLRAEERREAAAAAKRREIMEEREAAAATRREIMEKELKEQCRALIRERVSSLEPGPNFSSRSNSNPEEMRAASLASSCESMRNARSMFLPVSFKRTEEEEREDAAARRLEILELKEQRMRRPIVPPPEPGPHLSSSLRRPNPEKIRAASPASSCESTKSDGSMDFPLSFKQSEEEREAAAAKRREIREKELMEHIARMRREVVLPPEPGPHLSSSLRRPKPEKIRAASPASSSVSTKSDGSKDPPVSVKRPRSVIPVEKEAASPASSCVSMKSDGSMDPPVSFKPTEEEREAAAAKRREIREKESQEEHAALIRERVSSLEPGPNFSSSVIPGEEEAGSPAPSGVSMKSYRSKG